SSPTAFSLVIQDLCQLLMIVSVRLLIRWRGWFMASISRQSFHLIGMDTKAEMTRKKKLQCAGYVGNTARKVRHVRHWVCVSSLRIALGMITSNCSHIL